MDLVANLTVDGLLTPPVSLDRPIFTLTATQEVFVQSLFLFNFPFQILQRGDLGGFLDRNGQLNATQFTNQGLSLFAKVGIELNLRVGNEAEDMKASAKRYFDDLDRVVFINQVPSLFSLFYGNLFSREKE